MKMLCTLMILAAAMVIAVNMRSFYRTLRYMSLQTYEERVFHNRLPRAAFVMTAFFLLGYLITAAIIPLLEYRRSTLLIALIFVIGALFVHCMVRSIGRMAKAINRKTIELIKVLVDAIEAKDTYTKGHSVHVMHLAELLREELPEQLREQVSREMLRDAALLHDIGKISIPDRILNKPGRLTEEEMAVIRTHPKRGVALLEHTSFHAVSDWVLYHHERIDGEGYYHLPGEDIPLESRILAVADTFSALYTDRIYRDRLDYAHAIGILRDAAGSQLDEALVELFCAIDRAEIDRATPGPDTPLHPPAA